MNKMDELIRQTDINLSRIQSGPYITGDNGSIGKTDDAHSDDAVNNITVQSNPP
ncbi:hypothetical protein [Endozoicomonas atrinae]|uniref:hypothetical protein n=1 Tax=Endozoicomonas atrinae TaxID=1333660 RepID=UPI000AF2273E